MDRLCPCPKTAQQVKQSTVAAAGRKYRMKSPEARKAFYVVHIDLGINRVIRKSGVALSSREKA
jgi:hypothetical protein